MIAILLIGSPIVSASRACLARATVARVRRDELLVRVRRQEGDRVRLVEQRLLTLRVLPGPVPLAAVDPHRLALAVQREDVRRTFDVGVVPPERPVDT